MKETVVGQQHDANLGNLLFKFNHLFALFESSVSAVPQTIEMRNTLVHLLNVFFDNLLVREGLGTAESKREKL